ncbi:MAG: hypothetical protein KF764_03090 [Labilithrix sp.]|nr:hypothetical protein [Labilithrix sp.]
MVIATVDAPPSVDTTTAIKLAVTDAQDRGHLRGVLWMLQVRPRYSSGVCHITFSRTAAPRYEYERAADAGSVWMMFEVGLSGHVHGPRATERALTDEVVAVLRDLEVEVSEVTAFDVDRPGAYRWRPEDEPPPPRTSPTAWERLAAVTEEWS